MENYHAAMVLMEVGNKIGYHNARHHYWKRLSQLEESWENLEKALGSAEKRRVPLDIMMHIATAEALLAGMNSLQTFYKEVVKRYLVALEKYQSCNEDKSHAFKTKSDPTAGVAVRGLCIGMRFPRPEQITDLIQASIECGRMTHSYPTGYLGCLCMALFTSYAIQGKPVSQWGRLMLGELPGAEEYCRKRIALFSDYSENWFYFETKWQFYIQQRMIDKEDCDKPFFPENYNSKERNKLYRRWYAESPGRRKGLEITLMVYDAMLGAGSDWNKLCQWAMIHGGDSEATGTIVGFLYGLLYGTLGVPKPFLLNLGLNDLMGRLGKALYNAANGERPRVGDDPGPSGEFKENLRQVVKRLSRKRAADEINNLLNYMALQQQNTATLRDTACPSKGERNGAKAVTLQPHPTRFQLLQSRFTKLGLKDNLERLLLPEDETAVSRDSLVPFQTQRTENETTQPQPSEKMGHALFADPASSTPIGQQTEENSLSGSHESKHPTYRHHRSGTKDLAVCSELVGIMTAELICEPSQNENGTFLAPGGGPQDPPVTDLINVPEQLPAPLIKAPQSPVELHLPQSRVAVASPNQRVCSGSDQGTSREEHPNLSTETASEEPEGYMNCATESTSLTCGTDWVGSVKQEHTASQQSCSTQTDGETLSQAVSTNNPGLSGGADSDTEQEGACSVDGDSFSIEDHGVQPHTQAHGPRAGSSCSGPTVLGRLCETQSQLNGQRSESHISQVPALSKELLADEQLLEATSEGHINSPACGITAPITCHLSAEEPLPEEATLCAPDTKMGEESPPETRESPTLSSPYDPDPHHTRHFPWKYRTHCYAEALSVPQTPKVIMRIGMRGGRLVKIP